ncbi:hypothetical protein DRE_04157 [Drechslerella stenobrocha 248]|uniref:Uncharacterized protein n=1 Tax=Drechslerella stenobrocha 248 TaxID=1043628 RepID=W7IC51_9PEZI|nr:hypothetical protein DRE_04157 [Drechslerella stenobrocha 248]
MAQEPENDQDGELSENKRRESQRLKGKAGITKTGQGETEHRHRQAPKTQSSTRPPKTSLKLASAAEVFAAANRTQGRNFATPSRVSPPRGTSMPAHNTDQCEVAVLNAQCDIRLVERACTPRPCKRSKSVAKPPHDSITRKCPAEEQQSIPYSRARPQDGGTYITQGVEEVLSGFETSEENTKPTRTPSLRLKLRAPPDPMISTRQQAGGFATSHSTSPDRLDRYLAHINIATELSPTGRNIAPFTRQTTTVVASLPAGPTNAMYPRNESGKQSAKNKGRVTSSRTSNIELRSGTSTTSSVSTPPTGTNPADAALDTSLSSTAATPPATSPMAPAFQLKSVLKKTDYVYIKPGPTLRSCTAKFAAPTFTQSEVEKRKARSAPNGITPAIPAKRVRFVDETRETDGDNAMFTAGDSQPLGSELNLDAE